jgi:hypothetical protein
VIDPIEIQVAVTATTFQTAGIRDNKGAGTTVLSTNQPALRMERNTHEREDHR